MNNSLIFLFVTWFGYNLHGQVDTIWQVSDAKTKLLYDLPINFNIYKHDSTTGFTHFEKWEYGACPYCCEGSFYFKTEEGTLTQRNPDIKEGVWMRYNSLGYKNKELFKDNILIEIKEQLLESQIAGEDDTLKIPFYELSQINDAEKTFQRIKSKVQSYADSNPIDNQACLQGRIIISFFIELDGKTSGIQILKGIHKTFDQIAIEAIEENTFDFCTLNTSKVRTHVTIPLNFKIK